MLNLSKRKKAKKGKKPIDITIPKEDPETGPSQSTGQTESKKLQPQKADDQEPQVRVDLPNSMPNLGNRAKKGKKKITLKIDIKSNALSTAEAQKTEPVVVANKLPPSPVSMKSVGLLPESNLKMGN